jgi:hypothetical protein
MIDEPGKTVFDCYTMIFYQPVEILFNFRHGNNSAKAGRDQIARFEDGFCDHYDEPY